MHTEDIACLCYSCLISHHGKSTARLEEFGSIFLKSFEFMAEYTSRPSP